MTEAEVRDAMDEFEESLRFYLQAKEQLRIIASKTKDDDLLHIKAKNLIQATDEMDAAWETYTTRIRKLSEERVVKGILFETIDRESAR